MADEDDEDRQLRSAALQNVQSILEARQRVERELLATKNALEEETRILEILHTTGAKLASQLDLQSIVQAVTDAGTELTGADFGAFFYTMTNADGEAFTLYTLSGAPREAFDKFGHPRATPLFGPTFRGEGVIRVADVSTDPRYGQMGPHHGMPPGHLPVRSYLAVPVIARGGDVLGGLFFGHKLPDVFSERSERVMVGIAAQAAIAIDNARLFADVRRAAEERARLLDAERLARAELERIGVMKDEFLATLSHELRTPLTSMLAWSRTLKIRLADREDAQRGLAVIERNAHAQAQLIDDLLDMNRIVSGKVRLDIQPTELARVVEDSLESVRPSAEAKSITVRRTIDPAMAPVLADPNRLQQIVWNLLANAVKFTEAGGVIDVVVRHEGAEVQIVVRDTGVGIHAEFLPYIFERFRQADSSTTRKYGGLGLGLSIVKHLVELHGGTISADSPGEGAGSVFLVRLPLRSEAKGSRPSRPPKPELSLAGLTVLLVDDDLDSREAVAMLLSDVGAEVVTAASAARGLEVLTASRPDILVSDIGMPERDGYQFMADVRALPVARGGATPAIALTAFAQAEDRTRALSSGYQAHVAKPADPRALVATISGLVSPVAKRAR